MKRLIFVILFMFGVVSTSFANSEMQQAFEHMDEYFNSLHGMVIKSDDEVLIDIGSKKVTPGTKLSIFAEGKEIIHPVSGQVLGVKREVIGSLKVLKSEQGFSSAQVVDGKKPTVTNSVGLELPVAVKLSCEGCSSADNLMMNNAIKANPVLKSGNDYRVKFVREKEVLSYTIEQTVDNVTVNAGNFVRALRGGGSGPATGIQTDVAMKLRTGDKLISIARGRVFNDDSMSYIVVASDSGVKILDPMNNMEFMESIPYKFKTVTNIEVADLDGDGQDEIYVTNIRGGRVPESIIFKHDGTAFYPVQEDIPYVFRSINYAGERRVVVQSLSPTGELSGGISYYQNIKGIYSIGEEIKGSIGKNVFGFGIFGKDHKNPYLLNINSSSNLQISSFKALEYSSDVYYGDTFNRFTTKNKGPAQPGRDGTDEYTYYDSIVSVTPRIETIDDEHFIVVQNLLYARAMVGAQVFRASSITVQKYSYGAVSRVLQLSELDPVIVDIFYYEEGGEMYLLTLTTSNKFVLLADNSYITVHKIGLPQ